VDHTNLLVAFVLCSFM